MEYKQPSSFQPGTEQFYCDLFHDGTYVVDNGKTELFIPKGNITGASSTLDIANYFFKNGYTVQVQISANGESTFLLEKSPALSGVCSLLASCVSYNRGGYS